MTVVMAKMKIEHQEIQSFPRGSILLRHRRMPPRHRHRIGGGRSILGYLDRLDRVVARRLAQTVRFPDQAEEHPGYGDQQQEPSERES